MTHIKTAVIGAALLCAAITQAQTYSVRPSFGGGYNVYNPYGIQTQQIRPSFGGGYNVYNPYGIQTQQITPAFGGGYNVHVMPRYNVFNQGR